jgi:hypothetical protein
MEAGETWVGCRPPLDEETVRDAERRLDLKFPEDYVAAAAQCPGGHPQRNRFTYLDPVLGNVRSSLAMLLDLSPDADEGVVSMTQLLADELPGRVIPIGDDGGGDYVCLDFRSDGPPTVAYFSHESEPSDDVIPLASSFSAFLQMLES